MQDAVAFPGLSINGFVQRVERRHRVLPAQAVRGAQAEGPARAGASPARSMPSSAAIQDAFVAVFPPPPVDGLGTLGGFKLEIEDRAGLGRGGAVQGHPGRASAKAYQNPKLAGIFSGFQSTCRSSSSTSTATRRSSRASPLTDVFETLQIYPRLALRERLQPLRPHLPGHRAGRRAVPRHAPRTSSCSRCATPAARWSRSARSCR